MSYIAAGKRGRSMASSASQSPQHKKSGLGSSPPMAMATTTDIINLRGQKLTYLDPTLIQSAREVDVADNDLTELPETYSPTLESFNCSNNHITSLPIDKMPPTLISIIANNNAIESLPFLPSETRLQVISIDNNKLTKLPPLPGTLHILSVAHNYLVSLPPVLPTTLRVLNVGYNTLTAIPLDISNCHNLEIFICNDNNLSQVPPRLPPTLTELNMSNNPIRILPLLPEGLIKLNIERTSINPNIIAIFNNFNTKTAEEKKRIIQNVNGKLYPPSATAAAAPTSPTAPLIMKSSIPVLISQGSYGCAYRPSIKCADAKPDDYYNNKIAKLMGQREATRENAEYAAIAAADPHQQFYLGMPDICTPEPSYTDYIHNCKAIHKLRPGDSPALLIMKNGGDNIAMHVHKLKARINDLIARGRAFDRNTTYIKHTDRFLLAMYKLFYGLKMLRDNNLIHLDIKPQNIVYNIENGEMKFIDFGMMGKLSDYINGSKGVKTYWWSYPWEFQYAAPENFRKLLQKCNIPIMPDGPADGIDDELFTMDDKQHIDYFEIIYDMNLQLPPTAPDYNKNVAMFQKLFDLMYNPALTAFFLEIQAGTKNPEIPINIENIMDKTDETTTANVMQMYLALYEKSYRTFDLYGMGITLMYYLTRMQFIIPEALVKALAGLANAMITPNVFKRITVDGAIYMFQRIIREHGLLDRNPGFAQKLEAEGMLSRPVGSSTSSS